MKKVFINVCSFLVTIAIISVAAVTALNFRNIYYLDIKRLDIPAMSGYTEQEIIENYNYLIDYNTSFDDEEFKLPSMRFSREGKIHFEEVRNIFHSLYYIMWIGLLAFIAVIYEAFKGRTKPLKNVLKMLIILPVIVAIPMLVAFDKVFVLFHKIMFRNDYWIFDPVLDPVINILPEEFFYHEALLIVSLTVIMWVILLIAYRIFSDREEKQS